MECEKGCPCQPSKIWRSCFHVRLGTLWFAFWCVVLLSLGLVETVITPDFPPAGGVFMAKKLVLPQDHLSSKWVSRWFTLLSPSQDNSSLFQINTLQLFIKKCMKSSLPRDSLVWWVIRLALKNNFRLQWKIFGCFQKFHFICKCLLSAISHIMNFTSVRQHSTRTMFHM